MAGLFGLFDYTKEGPGVAKQQRKKKGFFYFFELYFRNFWALLRMNLLYGLISLGVVTNGLANCGMTRVARSMSRSKHSFLQEDFMETVKKNLKQGLLFGALNLVATAVLAFDVYFFYSNTIKAEGASVAVIGLGVSLFLAVMFTFMKYYLWTLIITFSLDFKTLIKNSFRLAFLNIWRNIFVSLCLGVWYAVMVSLPFLFGRSWPVAIVIDLLILLLLFPGFKTFLVQANTFPAIQKYMIDPYYAVHKGEDIEKRLALGLEVSQDELPQNQESPVFHDEVQE